MKAILKFLPVCLLCLGCDTWLPQPGKVSATAVPAPHPRALAHPDDAVSVFDASMTKLAIFSSNEDQRPFEVVTARIENHTHHVIDEVWIEVHVKDKADEFEFDSTVIKLQNLRLPPDEGVVAFSREVRLVPPDKPWTWTYDVIYVATAPE